jgi:hypothetical protein
MRKKKNTKTKEKKKNLSYLGYEVTFKLVSYHASPHEQINQLHFITLSGMLQISFGQSS